MDFMNNYGFGYGFMDHSSSEVLPKWAKDEQLYNCENNDKRRTFFKKQSKKNIKVIL